MDVEVRMGRLGWRLRGEFEEMCGGDGDGTRKGMEERGS